VPTCWDGTGALSLRSITLVSPARNKRISHSRVRTVEDSHSIDKGECTTEVTAG
jgi:hypothetical protein